MDPDENGATAAKDGTPDPKPQGKGSAKKSKKAKAKAEQTPPSGTDHSSKGASASAQPSPQPSAQPSPQPFAQPSPQPKPEGERPPSAKKQKEKKGEGQGQSQAQGQGQGDTAAAEAPQKSKAELKAERRAKQEAQRAAKAKAKAEGGQPGQAQAKAEAPRVPVKVLRDDPDVAKKEVKKLTRQRVPQRSNVRKKVALFSHLKQYDPDLTHLNQLHVWNQVDHDVPQGIHPAISHLGLQYATYTNIGSNSRTVGLMDAFQEVVWDYKTPPDKDMCRSLETHITRLISFLDQCRPLSIGMGNAIKFLKQKIIALSELSPSLPDQEAKEDLILNIRKFVVEKVIKAGQAIVINTQPIISNSEVIIVYAYSSVVCKALVEAENKDDLTVLVVDSRPWHEGRKMLRALVKAGIKCMFVPLEQAATYIRRICQSSNCDHQKTRLFVGAHGVLNNAHVMSRAGTATLTCIAKSLNIPVYVCFETYKITNRSQTDSFVFNELGNAGDLVTIGNQPPILTNWQEQRTLGLLNLMFDVTPNSHFSTFITEIGLLPDTSIPKVLLLNVDSRPTPTDEPEISPDCMLLRRLPG